MKMKRYGIYKCKKCGKVFAQKIRDNQEVVHYTPSWGDTLSFCSYDIELLDIR
jgi:hypothetical protein